MSFEPCREVVSHRDAAFLRDSRTTPVDDPKNDLRSRMTGWSILNRGAISPQCLMPSVVTVGSSMAYSFSSIDGDDGIEIL